MKWELDDNARSGFHYLVFGALVVGLPSLLIFLIDQWQVINVTADIRALQVFRNGYLLSDPMEVTATFSTRGERIATAVVLALLCGGAMAGVLWLIGVRAHNWAAGRWTAITLFVYFAYAAVAMPRRTCTVSQDEVVMIQHMCIPLSDLPIPFTQKTDTLTFGPDRRVYPLLDSDSRAWRVFLQDARHESEIAVSRADSLSVASGVAYLDRSSSVQ
jgi:hypothetical protein